MNKLFAFPFVLGFFVVGFFIANPQGRIIIPSSHQDFSSTSSSFQDVTAATGLPVFHSMTIVFGDYDGDGWVDLLAADRLFHNTSTSHDIRFFEVTESVGLVGLKGAPLFADLDNNGLLDVVSTSGQIYLQGSKDHFVESSRLMGFSLPETVHDLAIVDVNKDGWIDILAGQRETKDTNPYLPPKMFLNLRGRTLVESTPLAMRASPNYLRGIAVADYDNNGKIEAYFSNYRLRPNNLFVLGPMMMVDKAPSLKIDGVYEPKKYFEKSRNTYYGPNFGHSISSIWADLNNDGNLDLWVSNLVHKFVGMNGKGLFDQRGYLCDDSKIYRNTGAPLYGFVDMRPTSGIPYKPIGDFSKFKGDELWAQTTAADFDNDGLQDVYVSQVYDLPYSYSLLYRNLGSFKFLEVSAKEGTRVFDSYAAAWADLNNDGKMDLIQSGRVRNKEAPALRVFKNVLNDGNNFLRVQLKGKQSGIQAVTAQVRVYHSDGVFLRQQDGVTGTLSQQNDPTLHFGLGKVQEISKVEVRWPSGKIQTINNVSVNQTIKLEEPR